MKYDAKKFLDKSNIAYLDFVKKFGKHVDDNYSLAIRNGGMTYIRRTKNIVGEEIETERNNNKITIGIFVVFFNNFGIGVKIETILTKYKGFNVFDQERKMRRLIKEYLSKNSDIEDYQIIYEFKDGNLE